ncbi:A/G-specific adenine glycosylase [Furfurilactobacillus siliginis]|nr:A/G-specific adenine glycosylase [Furfurilactobacillus siliginis]GEK29521.1 A/G-specific adenine glycosylase [Furfurilactobacillus siliginis]
MEQWSAEKINAFRQTLLDWYDKEGRDLPWRKDHDPYHVWVSEIMLQQTQVNTVIPYYERFMKTFPTVDALAKAPADKLLKAWEGLGYYSRARNLQRAAQEIVIDRHGQWPTTAAGLQELTGIGPYTAGAIASIAFEEPVPAVDGNAFRVFSRLLEIDADIAKPESRGVFFDAIQAVIDPQRPGDFNQAIMDLGSSYMTAVNPDSEHSPVKAFNQAYLDGHELDYPVKTPKPRPVPINYFALVIQTPAGYLLTQRPSTGMLANMWTLPLVKETDLLVDDETALPETDELIRRAAATFEEDTGIELSLTPVSSRKVTHTFTHQKWQIQLLVTQLTKTPDLSLFPGQAIQETAFDEYVMPVVQQKMWRNYQKWQQRGDKS